MPLKCWLLLLLLLLLKSVVLKVVLFVVMATELPLNYSVSACLSVWLVNLKEATDESNGCLERAPINTPQPLLLSVCVSDQGEMLSSRSLFSITGYYFCFFTHTSTIHFSVFRQFSLFLSFLSPFNRSSKLGTQHTLHHHHHHLSAVNSIRVCRQ